MDKKIAVGVVLLLIVAAGAWVWYDRSKPAPIDQTLKEQFEWGFVNLGVDQETSMPKTQVLLRISGVEVPVGTYSGNCFDIKGSAWELTPGEVSGAICYFAGGGKEVGIFQEGGALVLKEGDVEEGTAEEPGFRGNFKALRKL